MRTQKLIAKAQKNALVSEDSFENAMIRIKDALDSLEKSKNSDDLGKLLFAVSNISKVMDVEAEEILYIENEQFIKKFEN